MFFNDKSFQFLQNITINNTKKWFVENNNIYQNNIILPIKEVIEKISPAIALINNQLETKAVINKAISRIYRDTRFSQNKLPFKNNIGFNFRKINSKWKLYPAFIFRINPDGYIFGLCVMRNTPEFFAKLRNDIDLENNKFIDIITNLHQDDDFLILGENYKKYTYQKNSNIILKQYYAKKNIFIAIKRNKNFYQTQKQLVIDIENKFDKLAPLYHYLQNLFYYDQ